MSTWRKGGRPRLQEGGRLRLIRRFALQVVQVAQAFRNIRVEGQRPGGGVLQRRRKLHRSQKVLDLKRSQNKACPLYV